MVAGNHEIKDYGILNDFEVVQPITIGSLGAFDSDGDGIQGKSVITVQLFQRCGRKPHLLLESATFDAVDSGALVGGFRYKKLNRPVTLLPGRYILTVYGFEAPDRNYSFEKPSVGTFGRPSLRLNDGRGLIRFLGCNRFNGGDPGRDSKQAKNIGPADRFAGASFSFSPAILPETPHAVDYAVLTAGVTSFPIDSGEFNVYGSKHVRNRYGSIALLEEQAFPLIVEPSGSRLIFAAAGTYNNNPSGARCVAFAHEQWGHALGDARAALIENAIHWTSRKLEPSEITIGLSTNMNAAYFLSRGYRVVPLDRTMKINDANPMPECDVLVIDFHGPYTERFMTRASEFVANGGGLVATFLPWNYVHREIKPMFGRVNALLQPFGMAYRASQTKPADFSFTNMAAFPYPPILFNAFPAAEILRENRMGSIRLTSLEKAVAMNTVAYSADGNPERLAALSAVYSGNANGPTTPHGTGSMGQFADVVTLRAGQANANRIGSWRTSGSELVALNGGGQVEYDFELLSPDIYRIILVGTENIPQRLPSSFDLELAMDGVPLGRSRMPAIYGQSASAELLTPYLLPGHHKLRVRWSDHGVGSQLRLQGIRIQSAAGAVSGGDGIKDWVRALVEVQSGLDETNELIVSQVSPACIEGRGRHLKLMQFHVSGSDENASVLKPVSAPNDRWYVNVPLASRGESLLQLSYESGARTESRRLRWQPINVFGGGPITIRRGDSLLLTAQPPGFADDGTARVHFLIGTNHIGSRAATSPMPHQFLQAGDFTVTGTCVFSGGISQSGSIAVKVVEHRFAGDPACWVGVGREWDLTVPPDVVLEADPRMFAEAITPLPGSGWRYNLLIDQRASRPLLFRLGKGGLILDSTTAQGFDFWYAKDTFLREIESYSDGSQLVEMLLILRPVPKEVTVRLDVSVGGVVFEDGTITQELTSSNFDAQGRCFVRFIRPASAKTSVCHSIKLFDGATQIGQVQ